ncbi:MAG TPA: DUF4159 domain-containing protein [Acidobacteriota bacterium]|nr:DUF4159 domain-containing protein [Acidobacteriota bacterium]
MRSNRSYLGSRAACCALVSILGWVALFAQSASTPGFLRKSAQRNYSFAAGEPEFTFVRIVYTGLGPWGYYKAWYTDWPKADRQLILGIRRLTNIRVSEQGRTIPLTDPEILRYPFIYSVECGHWDLTDAEIAALREYLRRGGFLFCDDFWGSREWQNFQRNIERVLPEGEIIELPLSHPVFHCYYDISQLIQTPNVGNALYYGHTYEEDGFVPHCRGILDEHGRLMVIINWNTDLGDAWEWADLPGYPAKYSTYAYQIGINSIVYAMSH